MTSDIRLAFAHPEERAEATASADPRDRLSLRDLVLSAEIGAFQQERGTSQRLRFNVVVELRPYTGPIEDDVDRILSYDKVTQAIESELAAERLNLLETLAERIADRILMEPQAMRVFVRVEKLDRGPYALGVEIVRSRAEVPLRALQADGSEAALHPIVVHLSNAVICAPDLAARLDALNARERPIILCVGIGETLPPVAQSAAVQRRIDLLAIEQNAWVLAGRDSRCVVVQSRTEIDWALRHGQMIVWAPAKLVLDAVDGPSTPPSKAVALSLWLAETLAADRLLLLGGAQDPADDHAPAGSRVPIEIHPL